MKYDHGFVDLCTGKNVVVDIDSFISLNNHSDKLSSRELAALLYACSDHQPLQETLETKALSFLFNITSGFSSEYFCPDSSIIQINESEELSDKLAQTPGFKQLVSWTITSEFDHYKKDLDFTVQEDATVDFCVTSLGTCIALSD